MSDDLARFAAIGRLYGVDGLKRLSQAHVCVIGLGGVGCWAVEALARTGIGQLTLVDLDEVCLSNMNRQIHALDDTIGRSKALVLAERVAKAGLSVKATLCERRDGGEVVRCPHADRCSYLNQWASLDAAPQLRFEAATYLTPQSLGQ